MNESGIMGNLSESSNTLANNGFAKGVKGLFSDDSIWSKIVFLIKHLLPIPIDTISLLRISSKD